VLVKMRYVPVWHSMAGRRTSRNTPTATLQGGLQKAN